MLIEQKPYIDEEGVEHDNLTRQYSDEGKYILQVETNRIYEDAIDVIPCRYTYEETDEDIPVYLEEFDNLNISSNEDNTGILNPDYQGKLN